MSNSMENAPEQSADNSPAWEQGGFWDEANADQMITACANDAFEDKKKRIPGIIASRFINRYDDMSTVIRSIFPENSPKVDEITNAHQAYVNKLGGGYGADTSNLSEQLENLVRQSLRDHYKEHKSG